MPGSTPSRNSCDRLSELETPPHRGQTQAQSRRRRSPAAAPAPCRAPAHRSKKRCASQSISMPLSLATSRPVAMTMDLVSSYAGLPSSLLTSPCQRLRCGQRRERRRSLFFLSKNSSAPLTLPSAALIRQDAIIALRSSFGLPNADARIARRIPAFVKTVPRSVQHRLRGDAADVEAGAAESGVLFDDRRFSGPAARRSWRRHSRRGRCR